MNKSGSLAELGILLEVTPNASNPIKWSWNNFSAAQHVRVPLIDAARLDMLKSISKASRRSLIDIVLHLLYRTFQDGHILEAVSRPEMVELGKKSKHCSVWLSHALMTKLRDHAWRYRVLTVHPKRESTDPAPNRLIGMAVDYQLTKHDTQHWIDVFSHGDDITERALYEIKRYSEDVSDSAWFSRVVPGTKRRR